VEAQQDDQWRTNDQDDRQRSYQKHRKRTDDDRHPNEYDRKRTNDYCPFHTQLGRNAKQARATFVRAIDADPELDE